jgi:pimeloyl-ACP methyl ester carboxylesterase
MAPHFFCEPSNVKAIRATSEAYGNGDLRTRLAKYHADVDGAFHGWAATWLDPEFANWNVRDEVQHWRHPVLFIQGRDDPYGSEGQADAAAASPCADIHWLDDCAHGPHLERSSETLAMISGFVARVVSDGG